MASGWREWLSAWKDLRIEVDRFLELDDGRVLVLARGIARGSSSGLDTDQMRSEAAAVFHIRDGTVTRLIITWDRDRALADLGLSEEAMSQEALEVVKRAIAALNDHDVESYLACCTADVQMETPVTPIEGVYEGADGVRRYFADIFELGPDFRVTIERLEPVGARVLGFLRLNMSGRASGITLGGDIPVTNIWDFTDGKIKRVRIFLDRREALEAAGVSQ
jgi:ketosteroid isomerase-like protein